MDAVFVTLSLNSYQPISSQDHSTYIMEPTNKKRGNKQTKILFALLQI